MENTIGMALPTIASIVCMFFLGMGLGAYICDNVRLAEVGRQIVHCQSKSLAFLGLILLLQMVLDS